MDDHVDGDIQKQGHQYADGSGGKADDQRLGVKDPGNVLLGRADGAENADLLRAFKNRYDNDLALLTDMLDASNMKLSADMALVNARIDMLYYYFKLKYITNTL